MGIVTRFNEICLLCGRPATETHHLVYGNGSRMLADMDGLTAPLCHQCHADIHEQGTAGKLSKVVGQIAWEKQKILEGRPPEQVRGAFMKRYGRSYL